MSQNTDWFVRKILANDKVLVYIRVMEIKRLTLSTLGLSPKAGDLYTMAKASWLLDSTSAYLYLTQIANAQTLFGGASVAGTSVPAVNVQPDFYPVATKGAEAGCIVASLSWADNNLMEGYEWVFLSAGKYFVSGIMNSSQTLSNDPFDATGGGTGIIDPANWASEYSVGVNPF